MVHKRAVITGASGQDGFYLAQLLAAKGYRLDLVSRRVPFAYPRAKDLTWHQLDVAEEGALEDLLMRIRPDEIYNLAGVSRPIQSWDIPLDALTVNAAVPLRILDVVRTRLPDCRVYQASSSEIFGNAAEEAQDEATPVQPESPYAVAKAGAHWLMRAYRVKHGVFACSGILFNHESPRRGTSYATQKIATAAALIALDGANRGLTDEVGRPLLADGRVALGNIEVMRDFGFAGDYVRAMWLMLQAERPDDYVIGTGETHSIREVCEVAFAHVGLDWREHVVVDPSLIRSVDSRHTRADATRARTVLGWEPTVSFEGLIRMMVDVNIEAFRGERASRQSLALGGFHH